MNSRKEGNSVRTKTFPLRKDLWCPIIYKKLKSEHTTILYYYFLELIKRFVCVVCIIWISTSLPLFFFFFFFLFFRWRTMKLSCCSRNILMVRAGLQFSRFTFMLKKHHYFNCLKNTVKLTYVVQETTKIVKFNKHQFLGYIFRPTQF